MVVTRQGSCLVRRLGPKLRNQLSKIESPKSQNFVSGIFQTRILKWVAMTSSRRSSQAMDQTHISHVSCIGRWFFTTWASLICQLGKNPPVMQETPVDSWVGKILWRGIGYPFQYSWAPLVAQTVKNLPAMWETWV